MERSTTALLVGETGTGKTTAVQYMATTLNRPLTAINLSTQTESSDLLGGFKPIDAAVTARQIYASWLELFRQTFSRKKNEKIEVVVRKAMSSRKWDQLVIRSCSLCFARGTVPIQTLTS
jgi:midasin